MRHIVGKHVLVDMHGCNPDLLKKVDFVGEAMYEAAQKSHATIVGKYFKQFEPWGVSGVIIIAESHISIHTWPEHGIAAIDYFSCSESPKIDLAIEYLTKAFEADKTEIVEMNRGNMKVSKSPKTKTVMIKELANEMGI